MKDENYNGWSNYETWLVNIHSDGWADGIEGMHFENVYDLIDYFQAGLMDTIDSLGNSGDLLASDLITAAIERVDWHEIVDPVWDEHQENLERR